MAMTACLPSSQLVRVMSVSFPIPPRQVAVRSLHPVTEIIANADNPANTAEFATIAPK